MVESEREREGEEARPLDSHGYQCTRLSGLRDLRLEPQILHLSDLGPLIDR